MTTTNKSMNLALMALITALIFVLQFVTVPLGAITVSLSMLPVAIAAITMGPTYGLLAGAIWGLASMLKALMGSSGMTTILFNMDPLRTIVICFIPRMLDGYLIGWIYKLCHKKLNVLISGCITGFFSAFLNTVFFMSAIVLLFGQTEYLTEMMAGRSAIVFVCSIIAGNAIFEMLTAAIVTGPIAFALDKANLVSRKKAAA